MLEVLIRRGEANFGPLAPDEVVEQFRQGLILPEDEGWIEGLGEWLPMPDVVRRLASLLMAPKPAGKSAAQGPSRESAATATHAQIVRLRALGVTGWDPARLTRAAAADLIGRAEASAPAGRALLVKMGRMGLRPAAGITVAEARGQLEAASLRHYLAVLDAKGIAHTDRITAAQAEELAETGPPNRDQLRQAAEMGLPLPPDISRRSLDRLLQEAAVAETEAVEAFFGIAVRSAGCRGITQQQVRDVVRYLNGNFPGWREEDGERRFFSFVQKFYPHLSGDTPTTQGASRTEP